MSKKQAIKIKGRVTSVDVIIGENLHKLRLINNLNLEIIGEILGVSFQQVREYENGTNRISAENLYKLSDFYGVDIRVFYDGLMNRQGKEFMLVFSPKVLQIAKLLDEIDDPESVNQLKKMVKGMK
ncbi:MAG: hypothetical protein COA45_12280 [Zetaproteobacteria bacterium]|nr:MAG: hypothetical protein COA45_12280 [Zetaproteobacteria bacterium]